jgi:hypothetical protein
MEVGNSVVSFYNAGIIFGIISYKRSVPLPLYPLFTIIFLFNASRSTLLGYLYSNNLTIKYPKDFDEIYYLGGSFYMGRCRTDLILKPMGQILTPT